MVLNSEDTFSRVMVHLSAGYTVNKITSKRHREKEFGLKGLLMDCP